MGPVATAGADPGAAVSPEPGGRWRWLLALAAGAVLPSLAVLAAGRTLVWGDTAVLFAPVRPLVVEALRELRLPLWNPHEALGLPLHAQMIHGALHPHSVLAAWLAPGAGMDLLLVANVLSASLGAAWLARAVGAGIWGSFVAGWSYALSGYVLGMGAVVTYQTASATAPWAIAALRVAGRGGWPAVGIAALAVGALGLAGDPQWAIVAVALGTILAADAGGARGSGRALMGAAAGALAATIQLLPTWTFLPESERAGGLSEAEQLQWALSPWRLLELAAPGFFTGRASEHLSAPVYLRLGGPTESGIQSGLLRPFAPGVFVGAATLALAVHGLRASRAGRLLGAAAVVALWLALGHFAGAQQLLQPVPIWGAFRYSEKLVGPLSLCVAVLAGLGVEEVLRRPAPRAGRLAAILPAAAAALAAGLTLAFPRVVGDAGGAHAARALGLGLVHAAAGLALLAAVLLGPVPRRLVGPALAGITLLAGWAASPYVLHTGERGLMDASALAALPCDGPTPRVASPLLDPPFPNPVGLGPFDLDVAARSRWGAAPFNVPWRFDQVDAYTGLKSRRVIAFAERMGPDLWTAFRRFGLTHVVLRPARDQTAARVAEEAARGGTPILRSAPWQFTAYAVPHRAWARFADRVVPAPDEARALEALAAYELSGIDATVIEGASLPTSPGRVLAVERRREWLRVEAEAAGPALLVVSDAFWPGWSAAVDGSSVPVLRADALVRAVPFPPGRHVLEMRYDPPEVRLGAWISIGALAAAAAMIAVPLLARRGRRSRS